VSDHAFLAPSSAEITVKCHAFPLMASMYPEQETDDQRAGTASHEVFATVLDSYCAQDQTLVSSNSLVGMFASNGVVFDQEMVDCAQIMVDDVLQFCQNTGGLQSLRVEQRVDCSALNDQCWGTPDAWMFIESEMTVYIWDYKFGRGPVDPLENWQMITYLAGVMKAINRIDTDITVVFTVVQPRCFDGEGSVKRWTFNASDVRGHNNVLSAAFAAAVGLDAKLTSGNHCKHCPARHVCPAAKSAAYHAIDYSMAMMPESLTDDGIGFELSIIERAIKALEARLTGVKAEALNRRNTGALIPGWDTKEGKGNRMFKASIAELKMAGELLGIVMVDEKAITPTEFDKRLKALNKSLPEPVDASVITGYITNPSTGTKLIRSDSHHVVNAFKRKV
jgi:hypothetical protein